MRMFAIKECPYCKSENHIETEDWERVKCSACKGVFYAEIRREMVVTGFSDNGKNVSFTVEG